jgi:molybdate transport system substrate-binding protein
LVVAAGFASSCGRDDPASSQPSAAVASASGTVVVFAASSLTDALTEVGQAFHVAYPLATVTFNFAGSGDLVTQIGEGAPADVFVAADDASVARLIDAGDAKGKPVVLAHNTMEIIVEHGNPRSIAGLDDLAKPDLLVVLCAETVPCGAGAAKVLAKAGVSVTARSLEDKVKGVVTKVITGEADAGIVFVTDVLAAGDRADGVAIPGEFNVANSYSAVVTKDAASPVTAQAFIDFAAGDAAQAILAKYGFLAP